MEVGAGVELGEMGHVATRQRVQGCGEKVGGCGQKAPVQGRVLVASGCEVCWG